MRRLAGTGVIAALPGAALALFFAALPFQWIALASAGGFDFAVPYIASFAVLAALALTPGGTATFAAVIARAGWCLAPYGLYLVIMTVVLAGSAVATTSTRQVFFMIMAFAASAALAASADIRRSARRAGAVFVIALIAGTEAIARSIGLSWVDAMTRLASGDLNFVFYDFFRAIFNFGEITGDDFVPASQKNILGASLAVAMILHRAGAEPDTRDRGGAIITLLGLVLLIVINSRSVLIVAFLAVLIAGVLGGLRQRRHSVFGVVLGAILAIAGFSSLVILLSTDNALTQMLSVRFTFTDDSTGMRMDQYAWAVERIERAMLTGSGYATINGHPVHNLILSSFMHAGLPAFLLTSAFYGGLFGAWVIFMARVASGWQGWVLPLRIEWVATLPLLPLIRIMIMGDAGHPGTTEWLAIALFFALLMANARKADALAFARPRTMAPVHG